jgi:hypothetical protein
VVILEKESSTRASTAIGVAKAPERRVAVFSNLQVTSKGHVCHFHGSVEGPKSQFGSRNLKIQDREVAESLGGRGLHQVVSKLNLFSGSRE